MKYIPLLLFAALLAQGTAFAQPTQPKPSVKTLNFTCRVLYEPSKALWVRELEIDYSKKTFTELRIDGIKAHGFFVNGGTIITHMDNERIMLDLNVPSWRSELREITKGQGVCIQNRK